MYHVCGREGKTNGGTGAIVVRRLSQKDARGLAEQVHESSEPL